MTTPHGPVNLKAERLRRGLSVAALAREIDVSDDVIRYAEKSADRRPSPANALKIAQFFGLDVLVQWPLPEEAAA